MRCSRQLIGLSAAAVLFGALMGNASYAATAEDVLEDCKNFPDSRAPRTCEAYFEEVLRFVGSSDPLENPRGRLCVDENLSTADIIPLVIDWIEMHPGQRSTSIFDATHNALSPRFECE